MPDNDVVVVELSPSDEAFLDAALARMSDRMATAADKSGDKPYGDVAYADPGYQDDKKKRYPLDSEAHVRAAWSYINVAKNAAKYSSDQVSSIKSKIKSAGKKFDIDYSDKASSACLHTAFASKRYAVTDGETEQIKAAQTLRQQALRLLVMEAEEIADEGDEDTWDLECLLSAVRQIEAFISSEQWELYIEEIEDELATSATAAAKKDGDRSAFACPSCGSAVRLQRRIKTKLVSAAAEQGDESMDLTTAQITAIAQATADIILQAQAAARTAEETRAGAVETGSPMEVLKAAETRSVEDTRAGGEQSGDPKQDLNDLPTVASEATDASQTAPNQKSDPSDSQKISGQPGSSDSGPDGKSEKQPSAKAADSTLPDAPSGGEARTTEQVRANASEAGGTAASEATEAFKQPGEHKDEKAVNDKQNPARAAMDDEAEAAMPPQFQKNKNDGDEDDKAAKAAAPPKNDGDEDDKASAAAAPPVATAEQQQNATAAASERPTVTGGSYQRSYRLSNPADLDAYLASLERGQASSNVLVGMSAMHQIPTEAQTANAAQRRVAGAQGTVAGEQPASAGAADYDLTKLFSR